MTRFDKSIIFSILNVVLLVTIVFKTVLNIFWCVVIISLLCIIVNRLINKNVIKIKNQDKNYFFGVTFPLIVIVRIIN